jgi:hypothetical protein
VSQAFGTGLSFSSSGGYELEIIIGVMILYGIFRGLTGRKFTPLRVLRTPTIYSLFTLMAIFLTSIPSIYAQLMILLLPVGIPLGLRFGKDVKFFKKNDLLYYKRSPYILSVWAVALIARVSLELFSFQSLLAVIVFNALLSFITGMLLGEAVHILRTKKEHSANLGSGTVESTGRM